MKKWNYILPAVFFGFSLAGLLAIVLFLRNDPVNNPQIRLAVAKGIVQFTTVVFLGSVLSFVVTEFSRARTRLLERNQMRKDFLKAIVAAYSTTKKIRRMIIAQSTSLKRYEEQMQLLMDTQLEFESIGREIEASVNLFSRSEQLTADIRSMEKYLNKILREYQEVFPHLPRSKRSKFHKVLSALADFTGPFETSEYKDRFVLPYRNALFMLQREILEVE